MDKPDPKACAASAARRTVADELVDRFLSWPLPASVCSDLCVTRTDYPHQRIGTNLLTATEARLMLEHVLKVLDQAPQSEIEPRAGIRISNSYQDVFNAIAAAVKIVDGNGIGISVEAFLKAIPQASPSASEPRKRDNPIPELREIEPPSDKVKRSPYSYSHNEAIARIEELERELAVAQQRINEWRDLCEKHDSARSAREPNYEFRFNEDGAWLILRPYSTMICLSAHADYLLKQANGNSIIGQQIKLWIEEQREYVHGGSNGQ